MPKSQGDAAPNPIAEESVKTKRAREKLQKKFQAIEEQISQKELEKKNVEIHRWISRHATNRVVLKNKNISLFDENQNTAKISQRITNIVQNLHFSVPESSE